MSYKPVDIIDIVICELETLDKQIRKTHLAETVDITIYDIELFEYFMTQIDSSKVVGLHFENVEETALINGKEFSRLRDLTISGPFTIESAFEQPIDVFVDYEYINGVEKLGQISNLSVNLYLPIDKKTINDVVNQLSWYKGKLYLHGVSKDYVEQIETLYCRTFYYNGPHAIELII